MKKAEATTKSSESFPVVPNLPSKVSKITAWLRPVLDLQVASVLRLLTPWLSTCQGELLEVGCGAQPYRHLVPEGCHYVGLDWVMSQEHFSYLTPDTTYYNGETFPFSDGQFDCMFHTEVLEHVWDSDQFLAECLRVLKPGGILFFSIPFQARYHYIPHDYYRFTPAALEKLLLKAGFHDIKIQNRGTDITVAAYKLVSVIYRWLIGGWGNKVLGAVLGVVLLPLGLLIGQWSLHANLGSQDDALGYTVTARRP